MRCLDKVVGKAFVVVYLRGGLSRQNAMPTRWLFQCYKSLPRKFKKNLKQLYVVHPTFASKTMFAMMLSVASPKFGKKVINVPSLTELYWHVPAEQLALPEVVVDYDIKVNGPSDATAGQGGEKKDGAAGSGGKAEVRAPQPEVRRATNSLPVAEDDDL